MPALSRVLARDGADGRLAASPAAAFAAVDVIAVKLATGAPCGSGSDLFEAWPGPERNVRRWFVLANGKAVGVEEDSADGPRIAIVDYAG